MSNVSYAVPADLHLFTEVRFFFFLLCFSISSFDHSPSSILIISTISLQEFTDICNSLYWCYDYSFIKKLKNSSEKVQCTGGLDSVFSLKYHWDIKGNTQAYEDYGTNFTFYDAHCIYQQRELHTSFIFIFKWAIYKHFPAFPQDSSFRKNWVLAWKWALLATVTLKFWALLWNAWTTAFLAEWIGLEWQHN